MLQSVIGLFEICISYSILFYITLFIFGLFFGSFFKVIVDRSEEKYAEAKPKDAHKKQKNKSWVTGRSCCQSCGKQINWYDNIPLLSYLLLGGRCRYCKKKIGLSYPLVEFLTGIIFVFVGYLLCYSPHFFAQNFILNSLYFLLIIIFLWLILLFDFKYMIIPDELVVLVSMVGVAKIFSQFISSRASLFSIDLTVATFLLLFFLLLRYLPLLILKKYGLGWGDIKLVFPLAMVLGYKLAIVGIFCAFIIGGVWGIILLITRRAKVGQMVSFGPLLVLGSFIAFAWGDSLWLAYWQLL